MALTKTKFDPYSHKTLVPASRDTIYAEMEDITKVEHLCEMTELAFVRRDTRIGDIYNIYINNCYPPGIDMLKTHEYGHIRFSHFRNSEQKQAAIENAVAREWTKISKYFEKNVSQIDAAKWLGMYLNNILMDFEVNSKLFTVDEYDTMMYITDDILLKQHEKWAKDKTNPDRAAESQKIFDEFCEIKKNDPTKHLCQLCWPTNYDFPLGLDYEAYVVLAIKNLDKFIDDALNNMAQQLLSQMQNGGLQVPIQGQGQGQGQSSNSQGQSSSSNGGQSTNSQSNSSQQNQNNNGNGQNQNGQGQNQNKKGSGSGQDDQANQKNKSGNGQGKKVTSAIIKSSKKDAYEVADSGSQADKGTGNENSGNKGNSNIDQGDDDNIVRSGQANMNNTGGHGSSREGLSATPSPVSTGNTINDMMKFILNHAFVKAKSHVIRDQMYNYNRRKHNSNVIIPKNKTIEHYQLSNVVVLIDTSGSVSVKSVEDTLACIKAMRGKFNPNKSHVISWDTHLVKDDLWKNAEVDYSEGGTNIAKGIRYAKQYCKKDNDKLFVVSDFEDSMSDWRKALKDIPGEKYGICTIYNGCNSDDPAKLDKNNQKVVAEVKSNGFDKVGFNEVFAYQY